MKFVLLAVLPFLAAAQPPQASVPNAPPGAAPQKPLEKCGMEGLVTSLATGEPIKKANLVLRSAEPQTGQNVPESYSTQTGPDGKFAMAQLEPGRYRLSVDRTGFVRAEYGSRGAGRPGTILTLAPGQRLTDVNFRLTPHAVISGRVLDEDGEPVAYVQVQAMRYRYLQGRKQLVPAGSGMTNDLGEYRIFGLEPGRMYLSASYRSGMMMEPALDRSANPAPEEGYVPVYYPNTTEAASAAPLEVAAGSQLRGIDFTLSKARTVRLRGRVVNTTGISDRNLQLMLMPRGTVVFMGFNRGAVRDKEGHFEFRGVAPGAYSVTAMVFDQGKSYSARQAVDVGSTNVDNLVLTLGTGFEIHGSVRVEGDAPAGGLGDLRILLRPHDTNPIMFGPMSNARVQDDRGFTLSDVNPEWYNVDWFGLPDGYYVKSIRMGETDVKEQGLDLRNGGAGPLEIVLSARAATIEGMVRNEAHNSAPGVTVVLVPPANLRDRPSAYKSTTTDQYGRFTLKNLDPGDYTVLAWEDIEPGAFMDPDLLKGVESSAKSISVQEGGHQTVELTAIPATDESRPKAAPNTAN